MYTQDADRMTVLSKIQVGKMTFSEAGNEIKAMKKLQPVRKCFAKEMGLETWEEAEANYPAHSERLGEFVGMNTDTMPEKFLVT